MTIISFYFSQNSYTRIVKVKCKYIQLDNAKLWHVLKYSQDWSIENLKLLKKFTNQESYMFTLVWTHGYVQTKELLTQH
jgi:hypothetical protein